MATIDELTYGTPSVPGVIPKLRYRSNIVADCPRWIVSAVRNLTDVYPFEELSVAGPQVVLSQGVSIFALQGFTFEPVKVTRFDSFRVQIAGGPNAIPLELKWRSIKTIAPLINIPGQPIWYNIYGEKAQVPGSAQVYIAFQPNRDYPAQAFYQMKHPFSNPAVVDDEILLPEAWLEVVVCAAAEIGAQENAMSDVIQLMRATLYGDPKGEGEPGLIKKLISSRAQYSNVNERQLTFITGIR